MVIIKNKRPSEYEINLGPSKDWNSKSIPGLRKELNTPAISKDVQETSILSKRQIEKNGTESTQKQIVLDFIRKNPGCCIREIAEQTDIQKSSISPRLNKLRKEFKVKLSGQKVYKGKLVMTWVIKKQRWNKMSEEEAEKAEEKPEEETKKEETTEAEKTEEAEKKEETAEESPAA